MDERVKTIVYTVAISAAGVILPVLAALLVYGFSANYFVISDYIFRVGMLTAISGAVWSILPFFRLKSKLRKVKMGEEVEIKKRAGLKWEYILISAGVIIIVVSYFIAVL